MCRIRSNRVAFNVCLNSRREGFLGLLPPWLNWRCPGSNTRHPFRYWYADSHPSSSSSILSVTVSIISSYPSKARWPAISSAFSTRTVSFTFTFTQRGWLGALPHLVSNLQLTSGGSPEARPGGKKKRTTAPSPEVSARDGLVRVYCD
jgi:hypothetical protein